MSNILDIHFYKRESFHRKLYERLGVDLMSGSVLYLGMGGVYMPRMQSDKVTRTVIVEINPDIIDMYGDRCNSDWEIVNCDAHEYSTDEKFDHIVIDIWEQGQSIDKLDKLIEIHSKHLKNNGTFIWLDKIFRKSLEYAS